MVVLMDVDIQYNLGTCKIELIPRLGIYMQAMYDAQVYSVLVLELICGSKGNHI